MTRFWLVTFEPVHVEAKDETLAIAKAREIMTTKNADIEIAEVEEDENGSLYKLDKEEVYMEKEL